MAGNRESTAISRRYFGQKSAIFRSKIGPILVPDFILKNRLWKKIAISWHLAISRAIFVTLVPTDRNDAVRPSRFLFKAGCSLPRIQCPEQSGKACQLCQLLPSISVLILPWNPCPMQSAHYTATTEIFCTINAEYTSSKIRQFLEEQISRKVKP